jgi:catechol-2,3-dioxygenase
MVLIFNPDVTRMGGKSIFPAHEAITPCVYHFALEMERQDYDRLKIMLTQKSIDIEKELRFETGSRSIYFRDPVGNLVEFITKYNRPIED